MCGIVGAFPLNIPDLQVDAKLRRLLTLYLHNEILLETISRGRDATGVAFSFGAAPDDENSVPFWYLLKQPVDSEDFFENTSSFQYEGQEEDANIARVMHVACLLEGRNFNHIIGHTRAKTVGSEYNPNNNHPIPVGNIVGVHNGGVKNYKRIYELHEEMTTQGEVDSEALIQLIATKANDRAVSLEDIQYVTERVEGPRAVIAYNKLFPEKVMYFHDKDRPLELAYIPELGVAFIHSERRFLHKALHAYSRAKLTLRRDLPDLTIDWRDVKDGFGGIIDVSATYAEGATVEEMFPVVECAKALTEYGKDWRPPVVKKDPVKKKDPTTSLAGGAHKTKTTVNAKRDTQEFPITQPTSLEGSATALGPADLKDLSDYSSETDEVSENIKQVTADQVMDDASDDDSIIAPVIEEEETQAEEEGILLITENYTDNELLARGAEWCFSEDAKADESLIINRYHGEFSKYFSVGALKEADASEAMHQVYPDIFAEGFLVGFGAGSVEQAALDEASEHEYEEDLSEAQVLLEAAENKLTLLEAAHEKALTQQKKAAAYIANMKGFLMASIMSMDLAWVEDGEIVFSDDLDTFLNSAVGFEKVSPELVRGIFTKRDVSIIENGMVVLGKKIKRDVGEYVETLSSGK